MLAFIVRRTLLMIPTFFVTSIVAFLVIQLPPGDYAQTYISNLASQGDNAADAQAQIAQMRSLYGLDQPVHIRYIKWMWGILTRGDLGLSFEHTQPVNSIIWERIGYTLIVSLAAVLLTWLIAFPIGIYSSVRQYSPGDYVFTFLGFIGISVPSFLVAMVVMYLGVQFFGTTVGGLFSSEMEKAPWGLAKVIDLIEHIWLPVIILALNGTASLIRILRANLLDEMRKPFVITARAKGLPEWKVLCKYPLRLALNPFISGLAFTLPYLVGGSIILSVVMSLPLTGPMLLRALNARDMYLAGAMIMILSLMTIVGVLISDILLAWIDPRIRYQ
jgi:peptide/nickel transport system permease protein